MRKRWQLCLFISIATIVLLIGGFTYYNNSRNSYDSSSDGSEIAELQQQTMPPDVQKNLEEKTLAATAAGNTVLGTNDKKMPFPLPATVRVPILMYHYVEYVQDKNDTKRIALNTTPYTLEQEVKTLAEAGYTFMTMKELTDVFDGEAPVPPKPIALTFDDSYRDFYIDAYPILKKYNAKATQYVIAGFLNRPNHLLTSQLQEIASDGLVEIGAHTVHHVWLKGQVLQKVTDETAQSKATLEQLIQKPVVSFAYPFGAFDLQAVNVVQQAGFATAVSTMPGIDQPQANRYFLYRLRPGGRTGRYLLSWLDTLQNR